MERAKLVGADTEALVPRQGAGDARSFSALVRAWEVKSGGVAIRFSSTTTEGDHHGSAHQRHRSSFTANSTAGEIRYHDWLGDSYGVIFSHPRDFTPGLHDEFGAVAQLSGEFAKRGVKVLGVSIDSVEDHAKWKRDIEAFGGAQADFPIIDDTSLTVAKAYDMLPANSTCRPRATRPPIRRRCARSISWARTRR